MVTLLIVVLAVLASVFVTNSVQTSRFDRRKAEEDRNRRERFQAKLAWENELLRGSGIRTHATSEVDPSLRSLGNVGYLIWLLNYEPDFRDFSGGPGDQYPPDWEWRREFVFLRDGERCQAIGCTSAEKVGLDCHHIKPISHFASGEPGIHALSNLVTLCATCHATQHPRNLMLKQRAAKRGGHSTRRGSDLPRQFGPPKEVAIFPPCMQANASTETMSLAASHPETSSACGTPPKGIFEGLALVDEIIAQSKLSEHEVFSKSGAGNSLTADPKQHTGLELKVLEAQLRMTTQPMLRRVMELRIESLKSEILLEDEVEASANVSAARPDKVVEAPPRGIQEGLAVVDEKIAQNALSEHNVFSMSGNENSPTTKQKKYLAVTLAEMEAKLQNLQDPVLRKSLELRIQNLNRKFGGGVLRDKQ